MLNHKINKNKTKNNIITKSYGYESMLRKAEKSQSANTQNGNFFGLSVGCNVLYTTNARTRTFIGIGVELRTYGD